MKKINRFKMMLPLSISLILSSCNTSKVDVSLFIYNKKDTFIYSLQQEIEKSLVKQNYTYKTYDAELSQIIQNENIIDTIDDESSKILLINPVDRLSASAIIEKAANKQTPVIFFNREPLTADIEKGREKNKNLFYVGTDPTFEGETQAKMLENLFGNPKSLSSDYDKNGDNKIQMVMIKGEIGHQDTERRSQAVLNYLSNKGYQVEVLTSTYCNWSRETAYENIQDIIRDYGDKIEVIVSNNDDMAIGAIDYLLEKEIFSKDESKQAYPIVGVDGTSIGQSYVKEGLLYGSVINEGEKQAETIIALAKYLLEGKTIDDTFPYETSNGYTFYVEGKGLTKEDFVENK